MSALSLARASVDRAYALHDTLYNVDTEERSRIFRAAQAEALERIEACKAELDAESPEEQALLWCLRGKVATLGEGGQASKEAEALLADAVKLDPSLVDAWNCLSEVYWQRGEVDTARYTLMGALGHERAPETLCLLSMMTRAIAGGMANGQNPDKAILGQLLGESVDLAKESVRRDARAGKYWHGLGCAHLAVYNHLNKSAEELHFALKAFSQVARATAPPPSGAAGGAIAATGAAEVVATTTMTEEAQAGSGADASGGEAGGAAAAHLAHTNPDCHVNHAHVWWHLDEFQSAIDHFGRAHELDRGLGAAMMRQECWDLCVKMSDLLFCKAGVKPKRIASLIAELPPVAPPHACALNMLAVGPNHGRTLSVKVVAQVPPQSSHQKHQRFVVMDAAEQLAGLSIYSLPDKLVQVDATLELAAPHLLQVRARHWDRPDQEAGFHMLRIEDPRAQLKVNGVGLVQRSQRGL